MCTLMCVVCVSHSEGGVLFGEVGVSLTVFFRVCVGTCLRECLFRCTLVLQGVCLMGAWGGFVSGRNV